MVFPDLSRRNRQPELMDDPKISDHDHHLALRGLARLNKVSGIARTIWRTLKPFASHCDRPLRILDVACGSGDVTVAVAQLAARDGFPLVLSACDISATALDATRSRAKGAGLAVNTFQADVICEQITGKYDAVMSNLFLHHLDEESIVQLFEAMHSAARSVVLVTDLTRDRRGYALAWLASRCLTRSPVVHADALLSVKAALNPVELQQTATRAGLDASIVRVWPRRMLLTARTGTPRDE